MWFQQEECPADDEELGRVLLSWLTRKPEELPLESFCEEGGWPGPWEGHVDEIRRSCDRVVAVVSVSFEERVSACCDLGSAKEELGYHGIPRYGRLEIAIDSRTGDRTVRPLP
ncbi:hypothetical protein MAMC_01668 [Methylacidimicrobium cyclopophantes]|uniref:TIR domain-containing protein n=1 Tax=Methylacidimicrobium cyclopophantes TaxID=1041766 RepID=A0A5E6MPV6_9BACT|nr:hypothetical protein [Methylacidimicrobium cyclopophantes]VVM07520.1 hypothetical protein MAMC_01668 [Methylacidimicrobium cyclopophantes]